MKSKGNLLFSEITNVEHKKDRCIEVKNKILRKNATVTRCIVLQICFNKSTNATLSVTLLVLLFYSTTVENNSFFSS